MILTKKIILRICALSKISENFEPANNPLQDRSPHSIVAYFSGISVRCMCGIGGINLCLSGTILVCMSSNWVTRSLISSITWIFLSRRDRSLRLKWYLCSWIWIVNKKESYLIFVVYIYKSIFYLQMLFVWLFWINIKKG